MCFLFIYIKNDAVFRRCNEDGHESMQSSLLDQLAYLFICATN